MKDIEDSIMKRKAIFNNKIPQKWFHSSFVLPFLMIIIVVIPQLLAQLLAQTLPLIEPYNTAVYSLGISFGLAILLIFALTYFGDDRDIFSIGLKSSSFFKKYWGGFLMGILYFSVIVVIATTLGGLKLKLNTGFNISTLFNILIMLLGFTVQGCSEEIITRGYMLQVTSRRYTIFWGVVFTSLFFAFLHAANPGLTFLPKLNLFLFAVFAALLSIEKNQIITVCGFHVAWNWVQGNFYGIMVSGINIPGGSVLQGNQIAGRELISGGSFGIEGSLLCTFAFLIGIIYYYSKIRNKVHHQLYS